jgi:hypothetical protein
LKFKGETIEERKAEVLIKLRKYKLIKKEKHEGAYAYIVNIPKDELIIQIVEREEAGACYCNH